IERLRQILGLPDGLSEFPAMPLPLAPEIMVCGIKPDSAYMFKSALMPLRLTFKTAELNGTDYTFIESISVAAVLDGEGSVQNFFRKYNSDTAGPYGIKAEVMDTYIRSCAGYCVISYILGIGDRHLDNLMLMTDGHLFHIDFGYILGRDPKPFAPPMKLTKEMIEGMGGATSAEYKKFTSNCYNAFLILRRSANLILNLFNLMTTANIPDIAAEPDKCVAKIEEQFRLDLNEEEAVAYLQTVINDSVGALFPQMVEQIHKYMQYWRK
ncbi:hypothetical protein SARC_10762, partial [Sphaeroforma arctica JP610]